MKSTYQRLRQFFGKVLVIAGKHLLTFLALHVNLSHSLCLSLPPAPPSSPFSGTCSFLCTLAAFQAAYHDIYWTTGDGGPQTDTENSGQDTTNLLGSMMRISVPSDGTGYEIPSGNLPSETGVAPKSSY